MNDIPQRIEAVNGTIAEINKTITALASGRNWSVGRHAAELAERASELGKVVQSLAATMQIEPPQEA